MDNKDKYLNEIVKIETEFSELLNSKLSGYSDEERVITSFIINQMIISKNPQFTGISARQQLEFTTHLLLTD